MAPSNSPRQTTLSRFRRDRTEVSVIIKYFLFGFNVIFWLIGCTLIAIGIWAVTEKSNASNIYQLTNSVFDPVSLLLVAGCIIFVIGFFGCVGALRENSIMLILYMICLGIIFLLLVAAAILAFACKDWLKEQIIASSLRDIIPKYRDDPDLQNLIDWVQSEWLLCCGMNSYSDWDLNIYFNCSSPGAEACGVPFSCCVPDPLAAIQNIQCGYKARSPNAADAPQMRSVIYTKGCAEAGDDWFRQYIIPIAGSVVGIAVIQILGICFAWNLFFDIKAQKSKWETNNA